MARPPWARAIEATMDRPSPVPSPGALRRGRWRRKGSNSRGTTAADALDRVGLADRATHRPHELSGGQKQRVAIARVIVGEPTLLLADEPTGALDTASGRAVMGLLAGLNSEGTTIAVITHDNELAASLPRRVRLRDGRVAADAEVRR
ncbi:hypothetical protein GCM10010182_08540 [Actinomadura cremea]|nr:hypothetical protein GCM10010182_08540 [Actinomadura cremea]